MDAQALRIAQQFGPDVFLIVFVLTLFASGLYVFMRMQKEERDAWRADMSKQSEQHRIERDAWRAGQKEIADRQDRAADKVADKLTELIRQTRQNQ